MMKFITYDKSMTIKLLRYIFVGMIVALIAQAVQAQTFRPLQGEPVLDAANIIDDADEAALNAELRQFSIDNGGRQIAVATISDLEGYDMTDYGNRYARFLKVGSKEITDGVVFLIAPNDRKTSIEVGTGLSDVLTDTMAKMIIEGEVIPFMKANDYSQGVVNGTRAIMAAVTPEAIELAAANARKERIRSDQRAKDVRKFFSNVGIFAFISALIFGLVWLPTIPKRRRRRRLEKIAARKEKEAQERKERNRQRAALVARATRERQAKKDADAAKRARSAMLAAMNDHERNEFLMKEMEQARQDRLRREKDERDRREKQRQRDEEIAIAEAAAEKQSRRTDTDFGSFGSDSGSSWSSGGGSDYDGGGASGDW